MSEMLDKLSETVGELCKKYGRQLLELRQERDQLRAELAAAKGLLARIHRDGGHHTEAVGVARSIADAHNKVSEWLLAADDRDALAADNERLWKALEEVRTHYPEDYKVRITEIIDTALAALEGGQMTAADKTRLLAERVRGWTVKQWPNGRMFAEVPDGDYVLLVGLGETSAFGRSWDPLTNLAHAGEVLEAMRAEGWLIKILVERDDHIVELTELQGNRQILTGDPVLPTAICHAALMANGVKEEEL